MENSPTICTRCMEGKDLVIIEHDVQPELHCSFCEKAQSELLCAGQPSCYGCYRKNNSPNRKTQVVQSMLGQQTNTVSSVLSYRTPRQTDGKLTKKVEALLKECRSNPLGLASMRKKALLYYGLKDTPKLSWQTFTEKCDKKHPLVLFTSYQERLVGGFMGEPLDGAKSRITDQECGIFQSGRSTPTAFWSVQGNKVRLDGKAISFGEPESLRIQFESMRLQSELVEGQDIELQNLYVFRL